MPPWFSEGGEENDVLIGTMVRMVRNLEGHPFPGWSTEESRQAVADELLPIIKQLPGNKSAAFVSEISKLDYVQRRVLLERKLISQCMAARQQGCHVVINGKQDITYMVNEEEHLVMHLFSNTGNPLTLIDKGKEICDKIGKQVKFATDARGEFLTSLPSEAGTGIQLYTVLQLPALVVANMMPQITRALEKLMLNISPLFSSLGDDVANLFVVYTAPIAPGCETDMCIHVRDITLTLIQREHEVRSRLISNESTLAVIPDMVARAYGLLQFACRLEYSEFINALCLIRLGLVMGYVQPLGLTPQTLLELIVHSYVDAAPYHMKYNSPTKSDHILEIVRTGFSREIALNTLFLLDPTLEEDEEDDDEELDKAVLTYLTDDE